MAHAALTAAQVRGPTAASGWKFPELEILISPWRIYMGVSKNGGTPKWMVKIMENPIKMDDLGVPPFKETSI